MFQKIEEHIDQQLHQIFIARFSKVPQPSQYDPRSHQTISQQKTTKRKPLRIQKKKKKIHNPHSKIQEITSNNFTTKNHQEKTIADSKKNSTKKLLHSKTKVEVDPS